MNMIGVRASTVPHCTYIQERLVVCVSRTDEVMLARFSSVWTLISLSALIVVSQCLAAPTTQRENDANAAAAAAVDAGDEDYSEEVGWRRSLTNETKTTMLLQTVSNCRLPGIVYAVISPTHC